MNKLMTCCVLLAGCGHEASVNKQGGVQPTAIKAENLSPKQREFYGWVKRHAEDSRDFRIVKWGKNDGGMREVEFSCRSLRSAKACLHYDYTDRITKVSSQDNSIDWQE